MKKTSPVSAVETLTEATEAVAAPVIDGLEGEVVTATMPEPPRVGAWFIVVYMLTYFGFNLTMLLPSLFSLAYKVQLIDPVGKTTSLGLILGIGGIFALIMLGITWMQNRYVSGRD